MRLSTTYTRRCLTRAAAMAGLAASLVASSAALAAPFGLQTSGKQVLVVTDPQTAPRTVVGNLALAGGRIEPVSAPARYGNCYLVEVGSADAATLGRLRSIAGVQAVRTVYTGEGLIKPIIPTGQVIVSVVPGTPRNAVESLAAQAGCRLVRQIGEMPAPIASRPLPGAFVLAPLDSTADPAAIASSLELNPLVRYSHPSVMLQLKAHATAPIDDPLYVKQWHLKNTGQLDGSLVGADISAEPAWQYTMGESARIAVIDDCVQKDHPDLVDNYIDGFDFVDQDSDPSPAHASEYEGYHGDGHGTATAGLAVARANGIGVRGVAPMAGLIGCRISLSGSSSPNRFTSDQDIADAFLFAEGRGAQVISNSWGSGGVILPTIPTYGIWAAMPSVIRDAINEVAVNGRSGNGVLVLFSAGNEDYPIAFGNIYAAIPNVMAVGATLRNDLLTCYSNYGAEQSVVAPGGGLNAPLSQGGQLHNPCFDMDIVTTDVQLCDCMHREWMLDFGIDPESGEPVYSLTRDWVPFSCRGSNDPRRWMPDPLGMQFQIDEDTSFLLDNGLLVPDVEVVDLPDPNYTSRMNGTSAACPIAAGVATLVFAINPGLTAEQVRNLVEHTADKIQAPNEIFDGVTGHNVRYGHGRVNALRAVQAATAGNTWPSPVYGIQNVSSQSLVRLFWSNPVTDIAGVLVVRGTAGNLSWKPTDGVAYRPGQQVAPGVVVVANDLIDRLDQTGLQTGQYDYGLFVRNAENYYSWGRRAGFSAESPMNKPTASISASPVSGSAPLAVHFAGGGTDKVGLVAYRWDFGDGSTGVGPAIDHTYTRGGTYMATLTVVNTQGNSAQTTVQIVVAAADNHIPTVSIVATPTIGDAPLAVLFQANASDPDGMVASYTWDFGDGSGGSGQTVEHIYLVPGTYGVAVTVTDNGGAMATATRLITVTGAGQTAARTEPADALAQDSIQTAPLCGVGTGAAVAGCLLALTLMRRRR